MKYTKNNLKELSNGAAAIETYKYTSKRRSVHTDYIMYIGNGEFDESEIEELPYDENGEIEADFFMMCQEDYDQTVNANCPIRFLDTNEPDDKIAVIVVIG